MAKPTIKTTGTEKLPEWAKTDDIVYDFWKYYTNSDVLEHIEMLNNTGLIQELIKMRTDKRITNEIYKHVVVNTLVGFLDDILAYVPKILKEEKKQC